MPLVFLGANVWLSYFDGVRASPAFRDFVQERGLADYWRETGRWADLCRPLDDDDFECF